MQHPFHGVIPATVTPFCADGSVDFSAAADLTRSMLAAGCTGVVAPGSLGEGSTLSFEERIELLRVLRSASLRANGTRGNVYMTVSALSTREAVKQAEHAALLQLDGLMVLPPYVHKGDWNEHRTHLAHVLRATTLPCMLYNNPAAYGVDYSLEHLAELTHTHANLVAVKDSTGDARRLTAIRARFGDRVGALVGLDDCAVEGARMGACGWVAGLANALPKESVQLWNLAQQGPRESCDELYAWFLPLLRLDTVPNFVQLIKLVMQENATGTETVRLPRLPLEGTERACAISLIRRALSASTGIRD
ncbi:MAG: dihydrodipicolinate synthase family protein [Phycisphaerales bacterium]|nr:dihydrodipicolinate synthase family protein [Phycisphaerales bacterium]